MTALLSATPPPILPADRGRILDATASAIRASTVDAIARIVGVIAWLVGVTGVVLASTENDALLVFAAVANVALAVVELVLIGASVRRLGRVAALQRIAEGLPVEDLDGEHLPVE